MNKKAEDFKKYLDEKDIKVFEIEEVKDEQETAVFRSHILVAGQQLPTVVIFDKSIFTVIRVQVSPQALVEDNQVELLNLINEENFKYKPFKLYFNPNGNLFLDLCLTAEDNEISGDTIYLMFNIIINYLNESYRDMMKAIWGTAPAETK